MRLELYAPHVARLDCDFCLNHEVDIETGEIEKDPRTGEPLERMSQAWAPCRLHAAGKREKLGPCPKGTPENPCTLLPQNEVCYRHYQECQATGAFPDDPLVKRHAELIHGIEKEYEQHQQQLLLVRLLAGMK